MLFNLKRFKAFQGISPYSKDGSGDFSGGSGVGDSKHGGKGVKPVVDANGGTRNAVNDDDGKKWGGASGLLLSANRRGYVFGMSAGLLLLTLLAGMSGVDGKRRSRRLEDLLSEGDNEGTQAFGITHVEKPHAVASELVASTGTDFDDYWLELGLGWCRDEDGSGYHYILGENFDSKESCSDGCLQEASDAGVLSKLAGMTYIDETDDVDAKKCLCFFDSGYAPTPSSGWTLSESDNNDGSGPVLERAFPQSALVCYQHLGYDVYGGYFPFVGYGNCVDENGDTYDYAYEAGETPSRAHDCAISCISVEQTIAGNLVGFLYRPDETNKCLCYYSDGVLTSSQPSSGLEALTTNSGSGAIMTSDGSSTNLLCFRYSYYAIQDSFTFSGYGDCEGGGSTVVEAIDEGDVSSIEDCASNCIVSAKTSRKFGAFASITYAPDEGVDDRCACVYDTSGSYSSPTLTSNGDRSRQCWAYSFIQSFNSLGTGECQDELNVSYDYVMSSDVSSTEDCARSCRGFSEEQYSEKDFVGFSFASSRNAYSCSCLYEDGFAVAEPDATWTRVDTNDGSGSMGTPSISAVSTCYENPDYLYRPVRLLNAASGGMKCLAYDASNNVDPTQFEDCDPSSASEQRFSISFPSAQYPERFVIMVDSDMCLQALVDELDVVNCDAIETNMQWEIVDGMIASAADTDKCMNHESTSNDAVIADCDKDESKSHVSVIPYFTTSQSNSTYSSNNPELLYVFPDNGIQLFGTGEFSSCKIDDWDVSLNEQTTIEFDFSLDSSAGTHAVCFDLEGLDGAVTEECVDLFNVGVDFTSGVANSYSLVLSDILTLESLTFDGNFTVTAVDFRQTTASSADLISRFSEIEVYSTLQVTVLERYRKSIVVEFNSTDDVSFSGVYFSASALVQDEDGSFSSSVSSAGGRLSLDDNDQVEVTGLSAGKRYKITLDPVDASGQEFTDDRRKLKAVFQVHTSCSCDDGPVENDDTGKPVNLTVSQSSGLISFEFSDNSVCEEAYAITRQLVSDADEPLIAFAPSYFFYSTQPCTSEKLEPGQDYMDYVSALSVGNTYEYCVSAVGTSYMVDTTTDDGSLVRSSNSLCEEHIIHWESSALVQVNLMKESGGLPVSNVTIDWELLDTDGTTVLDSGTTTTPDSGEVVIDLIQYPVLASRTLSGSDQLPLKVTVSKTTSNTTHTFLCDEESVECTSTVTYMSHLGFEKEIQIADATLLPISGTVYIGKSGETEVETSGCPVTTGVEVCLYKKEGITGYGSDISVECTETDANGEYILFATMGSWVYPQANLTGHVFEPLDPDTGTKDHAKEYTYYNTGFYASSDNLQSGSLNDHDFFDTTLAYLTVEVAGGLCDINLGTAEVKIQLEGCDSAIIEDFQSEVTQLYTVPAHVVTVRIEDIVADEDGDRQFVMENLNATSYRVDLLDTTAIEEESEEAYNETSTFGSIDGFDNVTNEVEEEALESLSTVRFQYDGITLMEPSILNGMDKAGNCSSYEITNVGGGESESFHVLGTGEVFDLSISFRQLIIPEDGANEAQYCEVVDSSTKVIITNKVGLDPDDDTDQKYISKLETKGTDLTLYTKCTSGCVYSVDDDSETQSKLEIELQAGIPKYVESQADVYPFSKTITLVSGESQHNMYVVVTGDYSDEDSDVNSFALPYMKPLLVIRDPPGGMSSVTYSNVETTVKISMDQTEVYKGIDGGFYLHAVSDGGMNTCGGIGVMACVENAAWDGETGADLEGKTTWLSSYDDDEYTRSLSIVWSYSTAGLEGQGWAGQESDVFLVPSFAIFYLTTRTVSFDEESCEGSVTTSIKFDVGSVDNVKTLSFVSYWHLQTEILPELERSLATLEANETGTSTTEEILAVNASIYGWAEVLADYEVVNNLANASDSGSLLSVGDWFSNHTSPDRPNCEYGTVVEDNAIDYVYRCTPDTTKPDITKVCGDFDSECDADHQKESEDENASTDYNWQPLPDDHEYWDLWKFENAVIDDDEGSSPLMSSKLASRKDPLDATSSIASQIDETYTEIETTGRIQFIGGGALLSMTLDEELMSSYKELFEDPTDSDANSDSYFRVGGSTDLQFAVGAGFLAGVGVGGDVAYNTESYHRMITNEQGSEQTTVTVEFGDPDAGDEFVVDIFIDPKYGTFVFNTVDGLSKCPHETGTRAVEDPYIVVVESTRPSSIVSSEDLMTFELEIANMGYGLSTFYLYQDTGTNPDGLTIAMAKDELMTWVLPSALPELGGSAYKTTVTVAKGPKLNTYDPVTLYLHSKCEFEGEYGTTIDSTELYNKLDEDNATYIEFTDPCAEVQWSGDLKTYDAFILNGESDELMSVTIYNPERVSANTPLNEKNGLESVWLEYRKVSDRLTEVWEKARDVNSTEVDFVTLDEDDFGYITAAWKYPSTIDGTYEIRLRSECSCTECSIDLQEFLSDSIVGTIDMEAPRVFGEPLPLVDLQPGEELSVQFTESLDCETPFEFTVEFEVTEFDDGFVFDKDYLDIVCTDNVIAIQFIEEKIPGSDYDMLFGRDYTLTIEGVKDKSGNVMSEPYVYESNFICLPPNPSLVIMTSEVVGNQYLPDEPIVFTAMLSNDQDDNERSTTYLELGVDLKSNTDDFSVIVNGEPLIFNQIYTLDGGESVNTTIAVYKASGNQLRFEPLRLFLRSHCSVDSSNPAEVTAELWNYEDGSGNKYLEYAPSPPTINLLDGVTQTKLNETSDSIFISSHCFDTMDNAESFLKSNVYATDDCDQDSVVIEVTEMPSSQTRKKNHIYNLVEYTVTATNQCGGTSNETFLTEVFSSFDRDVNMQGCNGVDENCDGVVDDCSEDRSPPVISILESVERSAYNGNTSLPFIENTSFNSIDDATEFLLTNTFAEDDCARDLDVSVSNTLESCADSFITIEASDPLCSSTNPFQTTSKDVYLRIDSDAPRVSVGYDHSEHEDFQSDGVLYIDQSKKLLENIQFWFQVEDNCPQDVDVEVSVKSNEFEYSSTQTNTVVFRERPDLNQTHQLQLFLKPNVCDRTDSGDDYCEYDDQMDIRIYYVSITATDYGGNVGVADLTVVVVPNTLNIPTSSRNAAYFDDELATSSMTYVLETAQIKFEV